MTVSDDVSPSPKEGGAEPARPPLNPPLIVTMCLQTVLTNKQSNQTISQSSSHLFGWQKLAGLRNGTFCLSAFNRCYANAIHRPTPRCTHSHW